MELKIYASFSEINPYDWDNIAKQNPFLSYAFLSALEFSGCAVAKTGWQSQILCAYIDGKLAGALPLYLKFHSYGEFVFDWAWAEAYELHGLKYYPKLTAAIPFTPVAGMRVFSANQEVRKILIQSALKLAGQNGISSLHILFPTKTEALEMQGEGMMLRYGVQFHWKNLGFTDFESYLASMRHDKRKKILQERRKVRESGIIFERVTGNCLKQEHWDFFMECYRNTHLQYQSPQPLNLDFFLRISKSMPENILLILAKRDGKRIAGAFNIYDENALYGRSWGALEQHPALHFETCYYQAIEFCLEKKIPIFEGGAQGEHKLSRGFLPNETYSAHWLAHPEFAKAVEDFLQAEKGEMHRYMSELNESNPFKRT